MINKMISDSVISQFADIARIIRSSRFVPREVLSCNVQNVILTILLKQNSAVVVETN